MLYCHDTLFPRSYFPNLFSIKISYAFSDHIISFLFISIPFAEALVAATREIGLEVSADKTKYIVMSRDQNAGRNRSVRIDNNTFERVEEFKYLGTTLTKQNSIPEEIKSRLRSGNACYHSVQNLLSSRLL